MIPCLKYNTRKTGDTVGLLRYQMLDGTGFLDVTGATVVFRMVREDNGDPIVDDKAGVVVDGLTGLVAYQRTAADVTVATLMLIQFAVTLVSGRVHKSPDIEWLLVATLP